MTALLPVSSLLHLLILPVTQKRKDCDPPASILPRGEVLGSGRFKCFVQGHKEAAKKKRFLCATGPALPLPKGNGCSRLKKVQSGGQEALAT